MRANKWKTICVAFCIALLFIPKEVAAQGTPEIIYDGKEQTFYFENVSEDDLFSNLKEMMPGDKVKQQITVRTKKLSKPTSIYLKADCENAEVFDNMKFYVEQDGKQISQNAEAFDEIKLGQYNSDSSTNLTVTLEVPVTVGNEIADKEYHINWTVIAQEDGKDVIEKPVKTGDLSQMEIYIGIMIACGVISIYALMKRRRKS